MVPFVNFGVVADLGFAVLAWRDDGLYAAFGEACPIIPRIIGCGALPIAQGKTGLASKMANAA